MGDNPATRMCCRRTIHWPRPAKIRRALRSRAVGGQIIGQSLGATHAALFFRPHGQQDRPRLQRKAIGQYSTCAPTRYWNCSGTNKDEIDAFERTHLSLVGTVEGPSETWVRWWTSSVSAMPRQPRFDGAFVCRFTQRRPPAGSGSARFVGQAGPRGGSLIARALPTMRFARSPKSLGSALRTNIGRPHGH